MKHIFWIKQCFLIGYILRLYAHVYDHEQEIDAHCGIITK